MELLAWSCTCLKLSTTRRIPYWIFVYRPCSTYVRSNWFVFAFRKFVFVFVSDFTVFVFVFVFRNKYRKQLRCFPTEFDRFHPYWRHLLSVMEVPAVAPCRRVKMAGGQRSSAGMGPLFVGLSLLRPSSAPPRGVPWWGCSRGLELLCRCGSGTYVHRRGQPPFRARAW
jgi:hypothetical protein